MLLTPNLPVAAITSLYFIFAPSNLTKITLMLKVNQFTFNPFSENTYVVSDDTGQCAIIDPGCSNDKERKELIQAITAQGLKPVKLLNTHCHIDHFPGNKFICDTYNLLPEFHRDEYAVMKSAMNYQSFFGFTLDESPEPKNYLKGGDVVSFGTTTFKVLFTPGHSPGHIAFYSEKDKAVFSGDVLFRGGVGRFDLPGASGKVLFETLTKTMMALPDDVKVYSGHGPVTTIGYERQTNPYLQDAALFG
jgi:glyoxylase-like metal-dependent hydrolase (beta-lactamase superfamily II)